MTAKTKKPCVVIVGAGFGGLQAAKALANAPVHVKLVDRQNYHLFQPLLYQIATAGLSSDDIAYPIRGILSKQKNLEFVLANVDRIDFDRQILETTAGPMDYDYLILAVGSQTNYFGKASLEAKSFGLKSLADANRIRNHILLRFEEASLTSELKARQALLTFVVCGGGPTGVEMSGAISELVRVVLKKDYPKIDINETRVILLEATDNLVSNLSKHLSQATIAALKRKKVEVMLEKMVEDYDGETIQLVQGDPIAARTFIWTAGVRAAGLVDSAGLTQSKQGRAVVRPTLQLPTHDNVFVIGDSAYSESEDGTALPMVAPVAIQQAKLATENIKAQLDAKSLQPFTYHDPGMMATIGRNQAVAQIGRFQFRGWLAWLMWLFVHLIQLVGFRNRLVVLIKWAWEYVFYDRSSRLILGQKKESLANLEKSDLRNQG